MAFLSKHDLKEHIFICISSHFLTSWMILDIISVTEMNQHDSYSIIIQFLAKWARKYSLLMEQKRDSFLWIFRLFLHLHARWKGTGEPCPNFPWKLSKFSLYRLKKYFALWYHYKAPFHKAYKFWITTPSLRLFLLWAIVFTLEKYYLI